MHLNSAGMVCKSRLVHSSIPVSVLQSARLYDAPRNHVRASYSQQAPILDAAFQDDSHIFLAGLDGIVKRSDLSTDGLYRRTAVCSGESHKS